MKIPIDPQRPNPRLIRQAAEFLRRGGVIAYPTDTVYGLGCDMFQKKAVERIYQIKGKARNKPLSFICADLKDISRFAVVTDHSYRLMKRLLPGPYTFILTASKLVPKLMMGKHATVGIRVPDHPVPLALVEELGNPIVTTSIPPLPECTYNDPNDIQTRFGRQLDAIIDSGLLFPEPSTILDLTEDVPRLLRQGKGDIASVGMLEIIEDL